MTVTVNKPPRPPRMTGVAVKDLYAMHSWAADIWRTVNQLYERTGGTTDTVAATAETANTAAATAAASQAGATIPTSGGSVTLTPSNPLSYTLLTAGSASIQVAAHTRTGAAAPLVAADVSGSVLRGELNLTYYVYYSDAGDLGGAQTFLATTSLSTVTGTAGYRIIGTIDIPAYQYEDRTTA